MFRQGSGHFGLRMKVLRFAEGSDAKVEKPQRQALQSIAIGISLVSLAVGFSVRGILIILNRHQAGLNGLGGGSAVAMIGGISALLVSAVFLVAACLHWRFRANHPAALPVRRQSIRFTFAGATPAMAFAVPS
jgi:hypothetical protein